MKKALLKDSFKEIRKSFKRFLSILVMALLGVGFFAGLRASAPDMQITLDTYFDNQNVYDIEVVSTLGLTDEDVEVLSNQDGVNKAYGVYSEDVFVAKDEGEKDIIKVLQFTEDINKVSLLEGKLPEVSNECIIDARMKEAGYKIGDEIVLEEKLEKAEDEDEEDEKNTFINTKVKIVGVVNSPLYLSRVRGTTSLGDGSIDYYIYVPKSNIDSEIYTGIYVFLDGSKEIDSVTEDYVELLKSEKNVIEGIKEDRQKARYDSLVNEATEKLDDAQKELDDKKKEAQDEIAKAEKKIKDGEKEAKDGRAKADKEFTDALGKLNEASVTLIKAQEELNKQNELFPTKVKEAEDGIKQIEAGISQIDTTITSLNAQKAGIESQAGTLEQINLYISQVTVTIQNLEASIEFLPEEEQGAIREQISALQSNLAGLNEAKSGIEQIVGGINECNKQKASLSAQITSIRNQVESGKAQLADGQIQINKGWDELNENKAKYEKEKVDAYKKLDDADKKIRDGKKELEDSKKEFEEKIADAEQKLFDARTKINDIENAKWYINDRLDLNGFSSYKDNVSSINKISIVFPIVFFVVAALISLTSMTRMVEEERVQIGTLKALGYNRFQIVSKYVIYASAASLVGGIIGVSFGVRFFPRVIIFLYEMMFYHMEPIVPFNWYYSILGNVIMLVCMVGATLYTAFKELNLVPAELMRPKAPKMGKKVFLEHVPFIWNNLNFTQKVTLRNMFRYKKRFLMTIIGIAGCTALIVGGFGLKSSISHVLDAQYADVYHYQMIVALSDALTEDEVRQYEKEICEKEEVNDTTLVYAESMTIEHEGIKEDITLIVTEDPEDFSKLISLNDMNNNKEEFKLDNNMVVITDKVADTFNIKNGRKIKLIDPDKNEYELTTNMTAEHYVSHYIYMTKEKYTEIFNEDFVSNVIYVQYAGEIDENKLSENLLDDSRTLSVVLASFMKSNINSILESLDLVVYILIISAGLLAFVVLYNLANVNISERIRELATIKVLGFYNKEVYDYVARETTLLTAIGIVIGLFFGYLLTFFILMTCEINVLRFPIYVKPLYYAISVVITIIFTMIVNVLTYFALKKIDMIESLKSIE